MDDLQDTILSGHFQYVQENAQMVSQNRPSMSFQITVIK